MLISKKVLNFAAAVGVLFGALGFVRSGSIIVGAALLLTSFGEARRIERYIPLLIGIALIIVAIVLPHGR